MFGTICAGKKENGKLVDTFGTHLKWRWQQRRPGRNDIFSWFSTLTSPIEYECCLRPSIVECFMEFSFLFEKCACCHSVRFHRTAKKINVETIWKVSERGQLERPFNRSFLQIIHFYGRLPFPTKQLKRKMLFVLLDNKKDTLFCCFNPMKLEISWWMLLK